MRSQKFICLAEMTASEKSPVSRQRTRMRRLQNQMLRIVQHTLFHLCRTSPKQEDDRAVLLIQYLNRCVCELFPTDSSVGIRLVGPDSQNRVQKKYALSRPFFQISVVRM